MQINIKQLYIYMDLVPGRPGVTNLPEIYQQHLFILQVDSFYMVYVYKKNKQINKWNERIPKKKLKYEHCGDLNPKTPWLPLVNRTSALTTELTGELRNTVFKCYRWIGKRVLYWNEFLKVNPCIKSTSNHTY